MGKLQGIRMCPQLSPLVHKNMLVFFANQYFLLAMLFAALGGFICIIIPIIKEPSSPNVSKLFDNTQLNFGPSGLCGSAHLRKPYCLITTQGKLGDQLKFNYDSFQHEQLIDWAPPTLFLVDNVNSESDTFRPVSDPACVSLFYLDWQEIHDTVTLTSSFRFNLGFSSDGSALKKFQSLVNKYENERIELSDIAVESHIHSIIELSIAQINGFYSDTALCDFKTNLFDLNVSPYPTSFSQTQLPKRTFRVNVFYLVLISLCFIPTSLFVVTTAVTEKVNHIYAALLAIGLTPFNLHLSILITYLIIFAPVVTVAAIVAGIMLNKSFAFALFFCFYGITATILTFSLYFSSFFKVLPTAQIGSLFTLIVLFVLGSVSEILLPTAHLFLTLLYFPASIYDCVTGFNWLYIRKGVNFQLEDLLAAQIPGHPVSLFISIIALFAQSIFMFFVGVYFDSILPTSEHHMPQHWAFPLIQFLRWVVRRFKCQRSFQRFVHSFDEAKDEHGNNNILTMSRADFTSTNVSSSSSTSSNSSTHSDPKPDSSSRNKTTKTTKTTHSTKATKPTKKGKKSKKDSLGALDTLDGQLNDMLSSHNSSCNSTPYQNLDTPFDSISTSNQSFPSASISSYTTSASPSLTSSPFQFSSSNSPISTPLSSPSNNPFDSLNINSTRTPSFLNLDESTLSHTSTSMSSDSLNSNNPFDNLHNQPTSRYFLQYGRNRADKLSKEDEYKFHGTYNVESTDFTNNTLLHSNATSQDENGFFRSLSTNLFESSLNLFPTSASRRYDEDTTGTQLVSLNQKENNANPNSHFGDELHSKDNRNIYQQTPIIQFPSQLEQDHPSISLKGLKKTFKTDTFSGKRVNALNGIDLRFYRGQIHSILGKNASGKSVLLSILGGFLEPTEGSVFLHLPNLKTVYNDPTSLSEAFQRYRTPLEEMMENPLNKYKENKALSRAQKRGRAESELYSPTYGICWQEDTLFEDLTCIQNLELFSRFKESVSGHHLTPDQRFQEIFQFLDMAQLSRKFDNKEDAKVSSLSGGQRRKLNLAIALLHNPQIVLLDHCTNGADVNAQAVIWNMLELQKSKRTIILATHSLSEALIGDRISIIKEGKLACSGSALFLKDHYQVGEYIFTIDKQPFISLSDQLFEHDFSEKKKVLSSENVLSDVANSNTMSSNTQLLPDSQLFQTPSLPESNHDNMTPTLSVDLHQELMSTRVEEIGFDIRSMLHLISDSNLSLTYAIQPQHESNIPHLLDYVDYHKDRLWIRATSLTTTSLDDVFRRAHDEVKINSSNYNNESSSSTFSTTIHKNSTQTVSLDQSPAFPSTNGTRDMNSDQNLWTVANLLDEIDTHSTLDTSVDESEDFFSGKQWYQTKLPRLENPLDLFKAHFSILFKKRLIMLFYHSIAVVPIIIIILVILATPIISFNLMSSSSIPISVDLDKFTKNDGELQFFSTVTDTILTSPSQYNSHSQLLQSNHHDPTRHPSPSNFANSDSAHLPDDSSYYDYEFSEPSLSNQNNIHFEASKPELLFDWFSSALTSSPLADSSKVLVDNKLFYQTYLSSDLLQKQIHEQSFTKNQKRPSSISSVLHRMILRYQQDDFIIYGDIMPTESQNPGYSGKIDQHLPTDYGLLSLSTSVYANMTSPLLIPAYISQYYAYLTSLHVNLQHLVKPLSTLNRDYSTNIFTNSPQNTPSIHQQSLPKKEIFVPIAKLTPIYKNHSTINPRSKVNYSFGDILNVGANTLLSLLTIIIGMFIIYHINYERSSKIYELHRLAGGNIAIAAYHLANICFDICIATIFIIGTFMFVHLALYLTLKYVGEKITYLSWAQNPFAILNLFVYLLVASISIPFQSYIAYYISPTSLTFAYVLHVLLSIFPILFFVVPLGPLRIYAFLSPTSIFFRAILKSTLNLWQVHDDDFFYLLSFDFFHLGPLIYVALGTIAIFLYHFRFVTLGFNALTGSLGSTAAHPFNSIRPYNRVTKQDPTVLEMKKNILAMNSRTGDQGRSQYAMTLHGLRKVYHGPNMAYFLVSFFRTLEQIFNPFHQWWRSDQRTDTKERLALEKYKLALLNRKLKLEKHARKEQQRISMAVCGATPDEIMNNIKSDSDDDGDLDLIAPPTNESTFLKGATVALNDLYFAVRKNSVTCIAGTNGSGKSTCLSLLTNEAEPSSSNDPLSTHTAFIENTNLITDPAAVFTKISYCPQANRLNTQLSGRQSFELYANLYGIHPSVRNSLVSRVIVSLNLQDVADAPCETYSPGQLRLVMIGISLLCNSEITLLDEFSNFLDPIARSHIHRLLKSLLHTRTIILASHMAEEIESLSDDIAIMSKGSLITVGSKSTLKAGDSTMASLNDLSLVYTVNIRVESVHVLMSVQSFVLSALARIPPPQFSISDGPDTTLQSTQLRKATYQHQYHLWQQWLLKCKQAGVSLADQRHNRFCIHVATDLFPLSTLFTRLENCKAQCGTHLVRYTASQPTVDQLFISVIERSSRVVNTSGDELSSATNSSLI